MDPGLYKLVAVQSYRVAVDVHTRTSPNAMHCETYLRRMIDSFGRSYESIMMVVVQCLPVRHGHDLPPICGEIARLDRWV